MGKQWKQYQTLFIYLYFNFYFYFILLYNTVLVLPYIDMNPLHPWWIQTLFFGAPKSLHGYCNHEIKRGLLLGRKVMTNLDSILKSRDITLPTKVRLVKAMVFPVVMYGYESWTVKNAER